jgi:SAM-dependent methyltransferase
MSRQNQSGEAVRDAVRAGYGEIARTATKERGGSCCGGGGCCGPATTSADDVAAAVGYAKEDLSRLPEGANMGLSCGNPTALASLREGEVVIDLGCGGGFDCFVAGPKLGVSGRVIGVDMTPDMLTRSRRNLESYRERSGLDNVEFRLGEIEHLPVEDSSVDVVISNCVINLSPDKQQVWREIARVLKPGGRVAVSDLALLRPLPEPVREDVAALVGCVAGASLVEETREYARVAGLTDIELTPKSDYLAAQESWQDPLYQRIASHLDGSIGRYVTSLDVRARKPGDSTR